MERLRILSAALTLREFDVDALVRLSRVKKTTVRTVLNRERNYFEVEQQPNGKRGGQPKKYRVWKEREGELRSEVNRHTLPRSMSEAEPVQVPVTIAAAEENLLLRFPECKTNRERGALLELSRKLVQSGSAEVSAQEPTVDLHRRVFEWLEILCLAELGGQSLAAGKSRDSVRELIQELIRASSPLTGALLATRYLGSPALRDEIRFENAAEKASVDAILDPTLNLSRLNALSVSFHQRTHFEYADRFGAVLENAMRVSG